jgi:hypothetical protein
MRRVADNRDSIMTGTLRGGAEAAAFNAKIDVAWVF